MSSDSLFMRCAIEMGEKARLLSPPNPWVGCVLVKDGKIIAEGHTHKPGCAHAEIDALEMAGSNAEGSTVYVTLEPCAHYGRTPPCTQALIKARVARVVVALEDPDPRVQGRGIEELRSSGIPVEVGVCQAEAERALRPYLFHRKTGRAYCLLKMAVSIDGRIAARDATSQWISGPEARLDAHRLRSFSQAIMVGSGTALADKPKLTVRGVPQAATKPLRIVFDRRGTVPAEGPLFDISMAPTLVITSPAASVARQEEWLSCGASVVNFDEGEPLESVFTYLGSLGIIQVMVEGGSRLHSSLLKEKCAQELVVYTGSVILGDEGLPAFKNLPVDTLCNAPELSLINCAKIGNSTRNDYFIEWERG